MDAFCVSCRSWSKGSLKNKENELLCLFFKCLHLYVNSVCFFGGGGGITQEENHFFFGLSMVR